MDHFLGVTNTLVQFGCRQFIKEIRYYDDVFGGCNNADKCTMDCFTVRYFEYPNFRLIEDPDEIANLDQYAHLPVDYYQVDKEHCLEDGDGNRIRVIGREKRKQCDNSKVYEEYEVKNSTVDSDYEIGDILYSIDSFTKVRCLNCCGGEMSDAL